LAQKRFEQARGFQLEDRAAALEQQKELMRLQQSYRFLNEAGGNQAEKMGAMSMFLRALMPNNTSAPLPYPSLSAAMGM
jgi:hypothetical protein